MFYRKKVLTAAILVALGASASVAQAAIEGAVCQINDLDGCAGSTALVSGGGLLTLRGYAYDLETGDRPQPGGYVKVRNEDTLAIYKLPIQRIEARPDILASALTSAITSEQYSIVNAGFIAQVFMVSLPPGSYSVTEARVSMTKAGLVNLPLQANNRATFRLNEADGLFRLTDAGGTPIPLGLTRTLDGSIRFSRYPPLRNGDYRIEAALPSLGGSVEAGIQFNYARPVLDVPVSIPLVQNFPGALPNIIPIDPLTKRAIDRPALPVVVDAVDGDQIKLDGTALQSGQTREIARNGNLAGVYRGRISDEVNGAGPGSVELFVNLPDAPTVKLNLTRWTPADLITVSASKPASAIKVEDIDIDAKLVKGSPETCQTLMLVRPEYRLSQTAKTLCALQWRDLPASIKHNPYRANALRGALPAEGDNALSYLPGVVYTDPATKTAGFYPVKSGAKSLLLQGLRPSAIELEFKPHKSLESFYASSGAQFPGKYLTWSDPSQERLAGLVSAKAAYRNIWTRLTYPDGHTREHYSSIPAANLMLALQAPKPWQTYPVKIESWYERAPEFRTEETLEFVGIPLPPIVALDRELVSHDQDDTVVTGYLGIVKGQEVHFNPETMGEWQVTVIDAKESKQEVALAAPVRVGADGRFTVNLGRLSAGSRAIKVKAQMFDGASNLITYPIWSGVRILVTQRGDLLEGILSVRANSGPAPFRQTLYFSLKDSTLFRNIGAVKWEQETEAGTWTRIKRDPETEYTGVSYSAEISQAGKRRFRALVVNRYSETEFATLPLELQAYNLPDFSVDAPAAVVVGKPVTLAVQQKNNVNTEYAWSFISSGKVEDVSSLTGPTLTLTPKDLQSYALSVTGREVGAPNTPQSAVKKTIAFKAVNPLIARASLSGPSYVEVGKTYRFEARHNEVVPGNTNKSYVVKGYWSLPDGSRVDAKTLDYTIQVGDTGLSYYTYVDGYPAETSVAFHQLRPWLYQWPTTWRIRLSPIYQDVPALIRYAVETPNVDLRTLQGEPLTYTWSLPNGVVQRQSGNMAGTLEIAQHGTYQVAVQVADTRGNVVNVTSDQFSVLPAARVKTEARLISKYGETYYAPGTYYVSLKVLEVPRGDGFVKNELLVNGDKVGEFFGSGANVSFVQPGDYEITVRTLTKLQNYGENILNVTVQPAPVPQCTIDIKPISSGVYLTPTCTVAVGHIRSYTWVYELDGQTQQATSKAFAILKNWLKDNRLGGLKLIVESDLGARFTQDIPLPSLTMPAL